MKMFKKLLIAVFTLMFLYGCVAAWLGIGAGVGIGIYRFIEGRLSRDYPLAYSRAWTATNKALENLQISISNSMDEGNSGQIEAVRRDGQKVVINLDDKGQGVTNISVRVGLVGDRDFAEQIHNEIAAVAGIR